MRLALTSASGCSACIWHTTTSSSRAGETSACSAWGLTWHRNRLAPWHLSYYVLHTRRPASKLRPHAPGGRPVDLTLLECKWKTGFASLAIHSAMIAGVVYATLHAA